MDSKIGIYSELLLKYSKMPKEEREMTFLELCHYPGERFEEICSRILEFFFQPNNKHGFRDLWFKSLCHLIRCECDDAFDMKTRTEEFTFGSKHEQGKKIDIILETPTLIIAIENKIGADLYNPLDIYKEHIDNTYTKLTKKCVVLTAHGLSTEEQEKAKENGFVIILYKRLFGKVRELLGGYVSKCNQKYMSFMIDFMMTVENRMNFMEKTELNIFFSKNKEEIENMLMHFDEWKKGIRKIQSQYLCQIKNSIVEKTTSEWWIYQDWDLGVSFQDNTKYRIGIESEFKPINEDPIGEYHIYITTWNLSCWIPYKEDVLNRYPIDENHILDEGKFNPYNRVFYHMPIIKRVDYKEDDYISEIVKRLEEYFLFLQEISSNR